MTKNWGGGVYSPCEVSHHAGRVLGKPCMPTAAESVQSRRLRVGVDWNRLYIPQVGNMFNLAHKSISGKANASASTRSPRGPVAVALVVLSLLAIWHGASFGSHSLSSESHHMRGTSQTVCLGAAVMATVAVVGVSLRRLLKQKQRTLPHAEVASPSELAFRVHFAQHGPLPTHLTVPFLQVLRC